jgi:hypothetical protein
MKCLFELGKLGRSHICQVPGNPSWSGKLSTVDLLALTSLGRLLLIMLTLLTFTSLCWMSIITPLLLGAFTLCDVMPSVVMLSIVAPYLWLINTRVWFLIRLVHFYKKKNHSFSEKHTSLMRNRTRKRTLDQPTFPANSTSCSVSQKLATFPFWGQCYKTFYGRNFRLFVIS